MFRLFSLSVLIAFCVSYVAAIDLSTHHELLKLIDERSDIAAISLLQRLQSEEPESFALNNYDYLLGRLAKRVGRYGTAANAFQTVADRSGPLRQYALWHLAEIARFSGDPILERVYLYELRFAGGQKLLLSAAKNRLARSFFETGEMQAAAAHFESLLKGAGRNGKPEDDRLFRKNRLLLAEARYALGEQAAAAELFRELIATTHQKDLPDDIALAALRSLDKTDAGDGTSNVPTLTVEEHSSRGWIYQFNRDFESARRHYLKIVNDHPSGRFSADAAYQIGRGFAQQNDFAEAIKWFERVVEQFPEHEIVKDGLLHLGSAYARVGKFRESSTRYQMFIERFPADRRIDRAYLNMVDIARDQGEETEALRRARTAQEVFRGKTAEAQALFAEARIHIARDDWPAAAEGLVKLEGLADLGGPRVPGGTTKEEVRFLLGYVRERQQNFQDAIEAYLSIDDGPTAFYGWLATERLRAMAVSERSRSLIDQKLETLRRSGGDPAVRKRSLHAAIRLIAEPSERKPFLDELANIYSSRADTKLAARPPQIPKGRAELREAGKRLRSGSERISATDELLFLGLYDEAAPEMEAEGRLKDPAEAAAVYLRGGWNSRAIRFAEPAFKLAADHQIELLPQNIREMLYPIAFRDELLRHTGGRNVDPRFLLAIMRQESRFDPTVKSVAAARGLMQFIPDTSERIARDLRITRFRQDDLFDPNIAIMFGSEYVSQIFRIYPNQPSAVAASYNGGEDNMQRWLGRAKVSEPERYVPEIMYSQTKDYVFKVMSAYRVYLELYDEQLRPK